MREFLAGWIIIQLLIIGFFGGTLLWEESEGIRDCSSEHHITKKVAIIGSMMLPLLYFTTFETCEDAFTK